MKIEFHKYQGTGNDFIMINNMDKSVALSPIQIQQLCDRKFGIGADGVILIEPDLNADFYVNYYNSDGSQSFCGNGSRCSVAFSAEQNIFSQNKCTFNAIDGLHSGELLLDGQVTVSMGDVSGIELSGNDFILNTGSPHYVTRCKALDELDIVEVARFIRYNDRFADQGINVNFVEVSKDQISMRTYERGVEDETLSCGTGVTAVSLSLAKEDGAHSNTIITKGGVLTVNFHKTGDSFNAITLTGTADFVFAGQINM